MVKLPLRHLRYEDVSRGQFRPRISEVTRLSYSCPQLLFQSPIFADSLDISVTSLFGPRSSRGPGDAMLDGFASVNTA